MRRQLQRTGQTLICQIRVRPHGPLFHESGFSAYEIFCSHFPDELLALLVEETKTYYDQTVAALAMNVNRLCASNPNPNNHLLSLFNKLFNCRRSRNQSNSNKPPLQKRPKTTILCCVLFIVLCIVCCVSQYCVVPTIKCKFFFNKNIIFS